MEQITVASFMTEDILTVEPSDSADQVVHKIAACRVSCLVVCEEDKPVGIITERDLVQYWAKWSGAAGRHHDGGLRGAPGWEEHPVGGVARARAQLPPADEAVMDRLESCMVVACRHDGPPSPAARPDV